MQQIFLGIERRGRVVSVAGAKLPHPNRSRQSLATAPASLEADRAAGWPRLQAQEGGFQDELPVARVAHTLRPKKDNDQLRVRTSFLSLAIMVPRAKYRNGRNGSLTKRLNGTPIMKTRSRLLMTLVPSSFPSRL